MGKYSLENCANMVVALKRSLLIAVEESHAYTISWMHLRALQLTSHILSDSEPHSPCSGNIVSPVALAMLILRHLLPQKDKEETGQFPPLHGPEDRVLCHTA